MNGNVIFYKDKDGFELPVTEFGVFQVYPNETAANKAKSKLFEDINNLLNPINVYQSKKSFFGLGKKTVLKVENKPLPEYQIELYNRILKTSFVKGVVIK